MKVLKIIPLILGTAICLMPQQIELKRIYSGLPDTVYGWKKSVSFQTYGPESLFEYINGGAELYISYGFRKLLACQYSGENRPDITVDLFDMGHSYQAYGVFSHSRETIDDSIGQGCEYGDGLLIFWKGKYYVSVMAYPETESSRKSIFQIARNIADSIKETGPLPSILNLLPGKNLVRESLRYFNHYIWLNSHFFISNDNILHIERQTEAVLAQYSGESRKYHLLLVIYPNPEKALKAHLDFRKFYLNNTSGDTAQISDDSWAGCHIHGNRLWVVFNAGSKGMISDLFKEISAENK